MLTPEEIKKHARIPYPVAVKKKGLSKEFERFVEIIKKQEVTLTFLEAFTKIPAYAKFLKDVLNKKINLSDATYFSIYEEGAAIQVRPTKRKDPGSFTLPCTIKNIKVGRSLADLGASINVMPHSLFEKLDIGELRPTEMILQLANRSMVKPRGVIEDVPIRVGPFEFPAYFIVLDTHEGDCNILLGRPFLATAEAVIDVCKGCLTLKVGQDEVTFRLKEGMKYSKAQDDDNISDNYQDASKMFELSHMLVGDVCTITGVYGDWMNNME